MPATARQIYVNLPVRDLNRSVQFFTKLGFEFDQRFTDESATAMIVNDDAFVMLLVEDRFKDFTKKSVSDAGSQTEVIVAVSANSRAQVNEIAETALAAGGQPSNEPMDEGNMFARSFQDPDGHLWEVLWMDPSAIEG
jgi:uncharacterized protein